MTRLCAYGHYQSIQRGSAGAEIKGPRWEIQGGGGEPQSGPDSAFELLID
jgi:hypothetical protein